MTHSFCILKGYSQTQHITGRDFFFFFFLFLCLASGTCNGMWHAFSFPRTSLFSFPPRASFRWQISDLQLQYPKNQLPQGRDIFLSSAYLVSSNSVQNETFPSTLLTPSLPPSYVEVTERGMDSLGSLLGSSYSASNSGEVSRQASLPSRRPCVFSVDCTFDRPPCTASAK